MRRPLAKATDDQVAGGPADGGLPDEAFERVDLLAQEFTERRRRGERVTIDEYAARHTELAAAIRALFPALLMVEGLRPDLDETVCRPGAPGAPADRAPPERLGEYRILREIGRGGMGVVYEAEQESLGRRVALKVLGAWAGASAAHVGRFHREARSAASLHHTNIVPVFGVGEHEGRRYYTMQFIHGAGLHQILDDLRRLEDLPDPSPSGSAVGPEDATVIGGAARPLLGRVGPAAEAAVGPAGRVAATAADARRGFQRAVARIGLQVAEALAHAHGQGVLHRDIKPSNVLLDGHGHAWVTDFGLAKAIDDEDLTNTGDLVGTVRYMAPERFRGACDGRSDVYALGLTLYELLARRPAFPHRDRHALMRAVLHDEPPRLEDLAPGVPRDLATIVQKAIEKAPADRYTSAAAMAADLRRFLDDRPIEARRAGPAERLLRWSRRNPDLAGLATAVAVLLVAIAAIATVSALRLAERRAEVERRLWEADLARARASRRSGAEGHRFDALDALADAAALGAYPGRRDELRDEAIACLALADLRRIGARTLPVNPRPDHVIAFSPDGRRLAIGDASGAVRVVALGGRPDAPPLILDGPGPAVSMLDFSDDGRRLAARYGPEGDNVLRVHDLDAGEVLLDEVRRVSSAAVAFDRAGARLAVGLFDGTVRVIDLDGRRDAAVIACPPEPVAVRFDDSGRRLAVAWYHPEDAVIVVDLDGRAERRRWSVSQGAISLAWSPDGRRLAVGDAYRDLLLIDPDDPEPPPRVLRGHKGAVTSVDYARRGHLLASGSWDGTVRLWHPESGEPLVVASSPGHWLVRFAPDDRSLSGGRDGPTCWRWEVADGDEWRSRYVDDYPHTRTWTVETFPEGALFASAGSAGVRVFDAELRDLALLPSSGDATVEVWPDGGSLLVGDPSGLRRWPIRREADGVRLGDPVPFGPVQGRQVGRVRVDGSGRRVAAVLDPRPSVAIVFEPGGDAAPVFIRDHPGLERIDLSPDGRLLATGTWKGRDVKLWDAETGDLEEVLEIDGSAEVVFSPDGRSLLTGSGNEYICWEVGTWRPRWSLPRREASNLPGKMAYDSDGRLVAVAWSRTLVRLVDARTGAVVGTFEAPTADHLAELGLGRDGAYLFVKDHGGGTHRWDLRTIRDRLDEMGIGWPELSPTGRAREHPRRSLPEAGSATTSPSDSIGCEGDDAKRIHALFLECGP